MSNKKAAGHKFFIKIPASICEIDDRSSHLTCVVDIDIQKLPCHLAKCGPAISKFFLVGTSPAQCLLAAQKGGHIFINV
jgi:hypothetical protein